MSYGIAATNANGEVLIDQNYRALRVFSEGFATVFLGAFQIFGNPVIGAVIPTGTIPNPVVFIRPGLFGSVGGYQDGSNFFISTGGSTIPYVVCSLDSTGDAGGGYGVSVFDPLGRTVFSSNRKYMRVVQGFSSSLSSINQVNDITTEPVDLATGWVAWQGVSFLGGFCNVFYAMAAQRTSSTNMRVQVAGGFVQGDVGAGTTISRTGHFLLGTL